MWEDIVMINHRPYRDIQRRKSRQIMVGDVPVGGDAPISVQTMTNTPTSDAAATLEQIRRSADAGADLVRVSCPDEASTAALKTIVKESPVPIIADIHFHYRRAIEAAEAGAACLRINPGNIGSEDRIRMVVDSAKDKGIPIRIGVNAGSLGKVLLRKYKEPNAEAMVESALTQIDILDKLDFQDFKISLKASEIFMTLSAYRNLASQIDNPFHLGITEAGGLRSGTVKSAIGLGALLMEGIGDTIRVSLAADPVEEVKVGFDILKSLGLRHKGVNLVACPSCSRQNFDVIGVVNELESRLEDITTPIDVAVIGCIVNGPGEAKVAEVGLTGASPNNLAYVEGIPHHKIKNERLVDELETMVRERVAAKEAAQKDIIASD